MSEQSQTDNIPLPSTDQQQVFSTPEDRDSVQSDRNDSIFDFQPLEEFLGPVSEDDILTEAEGAMIDKPTFYSPHSFRNNQDLLSRRCKALELGSRTLRRQLVKLTSTYFSRRLLNDVFPNESSVLNNLLINCSRVATTTGYAFTIRREYYRQILSALYQIRKTHGDLVQAEGYPVPELPLWGRKGDITEFHLENEYKILAICFRTEVESFLIAFDKHYNFLTKTPRSADLIINAPSRDPPPHFSIVPVTLSPGDDHEEPVSEPKRASVIERTGARLETGGPRNRRHSNLYNFGSDELGDRLRKSHPEGTPRRTLHTNKLREVLGDSSLPVDETLNSPDRNRPPVRSTGARSDDLERDSSSSRIFQNRHRRNAPRDNEQSDFEDIEGDTGNARLPRGLKDYPKGKERIEDPSRIVMGPVKTEAKETKGVQLEDKLKLNDVPKWDGNTDTIILWLSKINNLARYSGKIHDQLGSIVPRRLEGAAESWYWSLPLSYRDQIEVSWTTLKGAISRYYMNRKWLDKQKGRATRAYY